MRYRDLVPGELIRPGDAFYLELEDVWFAYTAEDDPDCFVPYEPGGNGGHLPHRRPIIEQWSMSTDGEHYQYQFDTKEAAIAELEVWPDGTYWIGKCVEPRPAEEMFLAESFLDQLSEDEDYSGEWAEGYHESLRAKRAELQKHVQAAIGQWLDRNDLRPKFWNIDPFSVEEYVVRGGKVVLK